MISSLDLKINEYPEWVYNLNLQLESSSLDIVPVTSLDVWTEARLHYGIPNLSKVFVRLVFKRITEFISVSTLNANVKLYLSDDDPFFTVNGFTIKHIDDLTEYMEKNYDGY